MSAARNEPPLCDAEIVYKGVLWRCSRPVHGTQGPKGQHQAVGTDHPFEGGTWVMEWREPEPLQQPARANGSRR